MEIINKIKEFVEFIEKPPEDNLDGSLLILIDNFFSAFHSTFHQSLDLFDDKEYPEPPEFDNDKVKELIQRNFPEYGYYNIPEKVCDDICDTKLIVGDGIDDLLDIYHCFKDIIWYYENTTKENAIWYFKDLSYRIDWEGHMRGLQYYIFNKIDEEYYNTEQPD